VALILTNSDSSRRDTECRLLNDPGEKTKITATTYEVVLHSDSDSDSNDPGMDRRDEGPLSDYGMGRNALVLDHKDLRLQTHTADRLTVETTVGTIVEVHRPVHTSVTRKAIIGTPRNCLVAIMDHHKQAGVNKLYPRSLRLRIMNLIPAQR
jgi:hypothetical protein